MINIKVLKMAAIAGIGAVIVVAFSLVNLVPKYVTESVTVVSVDSSGCTVETSDKFIVKISSCNAKPGETITATYDEKIKERYMALNMHQ
ncbi:MAG: hypothetical protein KGH81_02540 [Thaumarchaeota archaeon]|nr:hypothetical protein [Nitrososphaerota archaeon]MDE1841472.1 hypothetical protein [Nitrososphaerota archaeon]MDE1878404.1 hypothetical protein [Nitrososphaerota archaeon]